MEGRSYGRIAKNTKQQMLQFEWKKLILPDAEI